MSDSTEMRLGVPFGVIVATILAISFVLVVLLPGIERGGWAEMLGVIAVVAALLLAERWLRGLGR